MSDMNPGGKGIARNTGVVFIRLHWTFSLIFDNVNDACVWRSFSCSLMLKTSVLFLSAQDWAIPPF